MPNHVSPVVNIDNASVLLLTKFTGITIANGRLYYKNGYPVMLNNEPNTKFKSYFKTKHRIDFYTEIENIKSAITSRNAFLITALNGFTFKIAFENNELVQCYKF
tara:strand:+ start:110 stop:424 length:315 start_codon:yes stop_codon:yes gene_type:complete